MVGLAALALMPAPSKTMHLDLEAPDSNYRKLFKEQMALTCSGRSCAQPGTTLPSRDHFGPLANAAGLNGTFVEIGVFNGDFAMNNLRRWIGGTYVMIDPGESGRNKKRDWVVQHYKSVGRNAVHHKKRDYEVVDTFLNNSVDVVYVDAGHSAGAQREYMRRWWPKVKPGGLMCGDDYAATRDFLKKFWDADQGVDGPWIGMCNADPNACPYCAEQCRTWNLMGKEHRASSGVVKSVNAFSKMIGQPVGVALAGRPAMEAHFTGSPAKKTSRGRYWTRCDFPDGCNVECNDNVIDRCGLGEYRTVPYGSYRFTQPQFYFVKPHGYNLANFDKIIGSWGLGSSH